MNNFNISASLMEGFLISHGWNPIEENNELSLKRFRFQDYDIYLCFRDNIRSYRQLLDRALYTLATATEISVEEVERKIFAFQPKLTITLNKDSGKSVIPINSSKRLRELAHGVIVKSVKLERKSNHSISQKDELAYLNSCLEPPAEAASYKASFLLPALNSDLKISTASVLSRINESLSNLDTLLQENVLPPADVLNEQYSGIDLQFVKQIKGLRDASPIDHTIHFSVNSEGSPKEYKVVFDAENIQSIDTLKKNLENPKEEQIGEVEVYISEMKLTKVKGYTFVLVGVRTVESKKKELRVYLREHDEDIAAKVGSAISGGKTKGFRLRGHLQERTKFDNMFDVNSVVDIENQ